ncbi:MAG: hypothetical protein ACYC5Y_03195 [Symbiobacteriia bacterium]
MLLRFLVGAVGWSVGALVATGLPWFESSAVPAMVGWLLAAAASLLPLGGGSRPWWFRTLAAMTLPVLAAAWVVGAAQQVLPFGTGASATFIALSLAALGIVLAGYPWDVRALALLPAIGLLSLPLEAGWAAPGAGQYTLVGTALIWGLAALTVSSDPQGAWSPRTVALEVLTRPEGPATTTGVLGTLGELHDDPRFLHYDLETLAARVRAFRPDVLCAPLSPADLAAYRQSPATSDLPFEYRECLLPLAEAEAIAVAPVDPMTDDLRLLQRAAQHDPRLTGSDAPARERMLAAWQRAEMGAMACHDEEAQAAARACHEARQLAAPELEQLLWQQCNDDMVAGILDVLRENLGRRVLVVVAAEQVYWVREALEQAGGVNLLPPA